MPALYLHLQLIAVPVGTTKCLPKYCSCLYEKFGWCVKWKHKRIGQYSIFVFRIFTAYLNINNTMPTAPTKKPVAVQVLSWLLRVVAAIILLQTLFFKFTAAEESVYIFSKVGMEPWGRIGSGVAELVASILLLVPRTVWLGAGLSLAVIAGAIFFHLTQLGIEVQGDGGLLFYLALIVFACSAIVLYLHRKQIGRF